MSPDDGLAESRRLALEEHRLTTALHQAHCLPARLVSSPPMTLPAVVARGLGSAALGPPTHIAVGCADAQPPLSSSAGVEQASSLCGYAQSCDVAASCLDAELRHLRRSVSGADVVVAALGPPTWGCDLVGAILGDCAAALPREQVDVATMRGPQLDSDALLHAAAQVLIAQHRESLEAFRNGSNHGLAQ